MVNVWSARLLEGTDSGSSKGSTGTSQKRSSGGVPKPESSISGYSADQEGPLATPPVISINLHGRDKKRSTGKGYCPKRQKRNEEQYDATTVQADLERAGKEFRVVAKDIEKTSCLGNISIDLKGVKLLHSKEVTAPFVTSNVSAQSSLYDYESLVLACRDACPNSFRQLKHDNTQYSDRSTSSVSDTESDSVESHINLEKQTFFIPPLLEDSLDTTKQMAPLVNTKINSCNVISSASNAVTMSEMLQLCGSPRLVILSSAPFTIVHANKAFFGLSEVSPSKTVGAPFASILDPEQHPEPAALPEYMVASSKGNFKRIFLQGDSRKESVEFRMKVSPIVGRKTINMEHTPVTHFAIELITLLLSSRGPSPDTIIPAGHVVAMSVMG